MIIILEGVFEQFHILCNSFCIELTFTYPSSCKQLEILSHNAFITKMNRSIGIHCFDKLMYVATSCVAMLCIACIIPMMRQFQLYASIGGRQITIYLVCTDEHLVLSDQHVNMKILRSCYCNNFQNMLPSLQSIISQSSQKRLEYTSRGKELNYSESLCDNTFSLDLKFKGLR